MESENPLIPLLPNLSTPQIEASSTLLYKELKQRFHSNNVPQEEKENIITAIQLTPWVLKVKNIVWKKNSCPIVEQIKIDTSLKKKICFFLNPFENKKKIEENFAQDLEFNFPQLRGIR